MVRVVLQNNHGELEVDPFVHKQTYERWLANITTTGTMNYRTEPHISPEHSEILTRYILDLTAGKNTAKGTQINMSTYFPVINMTLDKIILKTCLGNAILSGSDKVYVKVHRNQIIQKRVDELEEGEAIPWYKAKTKTRFEHIEPYLKHSPRYSSALDVITTANSTGKRIPRLRIALIQGLAAREIISAENLEQRIMMEQRAASFTEDELHRMSQYLQSYMSSQRSPISERQAESWLRGEVIAPLNWDHFPHLAQLNPEFENWRKHEQTSQSPYFNYRLYVVVRQQIERKLESYLSKGGSGREEEEVETFITVNPEYNIIISNFLDEHNQQLRDPETFDSMLFVRVNEVQAILYPKTLKRIINTDELLGDGAYSKPHPLLEVSKMDWRTVIEHREVFSYCIRRIIENYAVTNSDMSQVTRGSLGSLYYGILAIERDFLLRHLPSYRVKELVWVDHMRMFKDFQPKEHQLREVLDRMHQNLLSGEIDGQLNLQPGTTLKILEVAYKLELAVPCAIKKYVMDAEIVFRDFFEGALKGVSKGEDRINRSFLALERRRKEISTEYGIDLDYNRSSLDHKIFLLDIPTRMATRSGPEELFERACSEGKTLRQYVQSHKGDPDVIKTVYQGKTTFRPGTMLFTEQEVHAILKAYGCERMLPHLDEDFATEAFFSSPADLRAMWGSLTQEFNTAAITAMTMRAVGREQEAQVLDTWVRSQYNIPPPPK